jgi:hypothetical protein
VLVAVEVSDGVAVTVSVEVRGTGVSVGVFGTWVGVAVGGGVLPNTGITITVPCMKGWTLQ